MTKQNPYLIKNVNELPETATVAYFDTDTNQNLTAEEWKELHPETDPSEIRVINQGEVYASLKADVDYPVYGPMDDALMIAGSQTILNRIRRDFPKTAELLKGNPNRTLGFLQKKGALSLYQGTDAFRVPCSHRDDYSKSGPAAGREYRKKIDEYVSNICSKGNARKHYEELGTAREVMVGYIHEEYYKVLPYGPSVGNTNTRSFKADISSSYNYGSTSQVVWSCMGGINVEDKRPASDVFMASFSGSPEIKVLILNLHRLREIEDFCVSRGIESAKDHIKNKQPAYRLTWDDL